jgi:hypothetical protein
VRCPTPPLRWSTTERHERRPAGTPAAIPTCASCPCPRDGGCTLKALITGACALILCFTPVAAGANPSAELARHVATIEKDQTVIAFFEKHEWLLSDPRFEAEAKRQVRTHRASLARAKQRATTIRAALHKQRVALERETERRQLQTLQELPPRDAICKVFGAYCGQAIRVSRCESGFRTTAQNGQYLGLFQMGSSERQLFGHGESSLEQAKAAHRYFVASGRDWSPWSCKP